MNKPKDPITFLEAKDLSLQNLNTIKHSLIHCVEDGMVDLGDSLYNDLIEHMEEILAATNWDELEEFIAQSKVLEKDIAVWLSTHGKISYSLPWPKKI